MPTRAFIAYDFALTIGSLFENTLASAKKAQPPELDIHYPGDDGDAKEQGTIWNSLVKKQIDLCDKFIAFVDLPNANVGFEIGYACGVGKPVGVYRFKDTEHAWLKQHPLRGHFRHQAKNKAAIHDAFLKDALITVTPKPSGGDGVVVLCPADGAPLLDEIDPAWGWQQPPIESWNLDDSLPKQFDGCGLVVWIITPHGKGDAERDGTENTCLSILAGYAEARPEIDLRIFIHEGARAVADMEHCSKRFKTNASIREHLTALAAEWSAKVALRKAPVPAPATVAPVVTAAVPRPANLPPLPPDHFRDTGRLFIGRQSELGTGADMVQGLIHRFQKTNGTSGTAGIRVLWVHGFGGMGKSWYLHRIRLLGEAQHPEICSLVIDWDKPESRYPLTDIPKAASEVYELFATRLCQRLGSDAADAFWLAKARVAAAHDAHKRQLDSLRNEFNRACTEDSPRLDIHLRPILQADGFWSDDKTVRIKKLGILEDDSIRYHALLKTWCHATGETSQAVCAPDHELADGLRDSIRAAMTTRPLLFLLDTCEVLIPTLDHALRLLFAPLFREAAPLLVLVGSRLRADIYQRSGSRRGWRSEEVPQETFSPMDFGAERRFTTSEIEGALGTLARPFTGDDGAVAERLHVATLGIPLALRGLLDLHEDGDPVLSELTDEPDDQKPLQEREQIRKVIGQVSERFLLNLAGRPEREDDLRDIVALALVPKFDAALFARYWGVKDTHARITHLASRYSLLSDGDLHPVVRTYLRRHWRDESKRPECFASVLSSLECAAKETATQSFGVPPLGGNTPPDRLKAELQTVELNLRSWTGGSRVVDAIARALTLALVYEADTTELTTLLGELPKEGGRPGPLSREAAAKPANHSVVQGAETAPLLGSASVRNLWHRDADKPPTEKEIVPWLQLHRAASSDWTAEESAALALLEGITTAGGWVEPAAALAALASLEKAVAHFGMDALPRRAGAGEAFFDCGWALGPDTGNRGDLASFSATAYERAIELRHCEGSARNNLANLYMDYLNRPEEAEVQYREAIRLNPKDPYPHNGLGTIYDEMNRIEDAETEYREAIRLGPNIASPHNNLGVLYHDHLDRPKDAESEYREAIRLDPELAHPHGNLGCLAEESSRWAEARVHFQDALALDGSSVFNMTSIVWLAFHLDDHLPEAAEWLAKATMTAPKDESIAPAEVALAAWRGDWDTAVGLFEQWVSTLPVSQQGFPWNNKFRVTALLRKAQEEGELARLAEPILAAAGRACWQPWAEALDAVLAGRDASGLSPKAAELHARITKPV